MDLKRPRVEQVVGVGKQALRNLRVTQAIHKAGTGDELSYRSKGGYACGDFEQVR